MKKVTKAVIPAAGFGTRFLPQTKAMPKEMLPLVDRPVIQHVVEDLVNAGIKDIIIVTGYHKRAIEDHFDSPNHDLIKTLEAGGEKKKHLLQEVERISSMANFFFARQKGQLGNATPLYNVKELLGGDPFIYTWADDFFDTNGHTSEPQQLINAYEKYGCSILACVKATKDKDYDELGFVGGIQLEDGSIQVKDIVEKPGKEKSPSDLAAISSQLYSSEVFDFIEEGRKQGSKEKEFHYIHILSEMIKAGRRVMAIEIENGDWVNTGNKFVYLQAMLRYGLKDPDIGSEFASYLKTFVKGLK